MTFKEIINQDKAVLVDFHADWCGPCKIQAPMLQELKDKLKDKVSIIKIDVDKNRKLASQYKVMSVPTLILRSQFSILININLDRKSTRLNSSHVAISYAVFCLIKKTIT